ncbi:SDR family oxidoreductase [Marivirga sp.]|uniref:SDR family NAD(P)-dependent oxidoreductase n=1 Tax=Marivirga sp. TaxID=2018662 RepID=UPI002D7E46AC|nr:SDR family oxidoreductase [Marivirga sp.]HET8860963.1 SDR family oxidoreductase [Marivirga sp.]
MKRLNGKVAAVFAVSGAIAGAVAESFAQHGAKVYVSAKRLEPAQALAEKINQNGGSAEAHLVDAMNETDIETFIQKIVADNGKLDIVFNGIGARPSESDYGIPATKIPFEQFLKPVQLHLGSQFLTSRIAAKFMMQSQSQGTILMLTASLSRLKMPFMAGLTASCTAIEGLTRSLAAEFGQAGIKVICLNPTAMPETRTIQETSIANAKAMGMSMQQYAETLKANGSLIGKALTLKDTAETAAFLVSDAGAVLNSHIVDVDFGTMSVI